jgi:hypothetical protein
MVDRSRGRRGAIFFWTGECLDISQHSSPRGRFLDRRPFRSLSQHSSHPPPSCAGRHCRRRSLAILTPARRALERDAEAAAHVRFVRDPAALAPPGDRKHIRDDAPAALDDRREVPRDRLEALRHELDKDGRRVCELGRGGGVALPHGAARAPPRAARRGARRRARRALRPSRCRARVRRAPQRARQRRLFRPLRRGRRRRRRRAARGGGERRRSRRPPSG